MVQGAKTQVRSLRPKKDVITVRRGCGGTRLFIVVAVLIAYAVGVIAMNAAVWSGHRSRWWWVGGVGALVVIAPLVT